MTLAAQQLHSSSASDSPAFIIVLSGLPERFAPRGGLIQSLDFATMAACKRENIRVRNLSQWRLQTCHVV